MTRVWPETPLEDLKHWQKSSDVCGIAGVDNIDIEGINRRAVQNRRHTANHDEIHFGIVKGTQSDDRLRLWH